MPNYVTVCEKEQIALPLDSDNTLKLRTLTSMFPNAQGLMYRNSATSPYTVLEPDFTATKIQAPNGGDWQGKTFIVVYQQSASESTSERTDASRKRPCPIPSPKKMQITKMIDNNPYWCDSIKKYVYYYLRDDNEYEKRAACAISPDYAVTYRRGRNRNLKARQCGEDNEISSNGDILTLYSTERDPLDENQPKQIIDAEVVFTDDDRDFIMLQALHDKQFFSGLKTDDILEAPKLNQCVLAIGFSTRSQDVNPTALGGIVSCVEEDEDGCMISDIISWGGDSGGGLFSKDKKLVGIISASLESDDKEFTRTLFVPASAIKYRLDLKVKKHGDRRRRRRYD